MNLRFFAYNFHLIPLLPSLYRQGKKIKARVPDLPEAQVNTGKFGTHNQRNLNLLCIGESTIAGVGVETHEEGFTGTLAKELAQRLNTNISWEVIARSGYTAQKVRERLVPKIKEKPDMVVVGLGGNDAFQLNSPSQWAKDVDELIHALRTVNPSAPIYFTNMPPIRIFPAFTPLIQKVIGGRVEQLGKALENVISNYEQVYFSNETIEIETWAKRYNIEVESNTFFSDGVHPSKLTYQVWAKDMATFIAK